MIYYVDRSTAPGTLHSNGVAQVHEVFDTTRQTAPVAPSTKQVSSTMTLMKDALTKSLKKGRLTAGQLLNDLSRVGGIPRPHFEYEAQGSVKKPSHFFKVRFRVPSFLLDPDGAQYNIVGAGRCRSKQFAKSLAALEAVHRLEADLNLGRGQLPKLLDDYRQQQLEKQEAIEATPITDQIKGVSWDAVPIDHSFPETFPARRRGRIDFGLVWDDPDAFIGAKAITLSCESSLPEVVVHANQTDSGILQRWANIRASGRIRGITGELGDVSMGATNELAQFLALKAIGTRRHKWSNHRLAMMVEELDKFPSSSFGMAKLFVSLPKHHYNDLKGLLAQIENGVKRTRTQGRMIRRGGTTKFGIVGDDALRAARVATFRKHQSKLPLPVDSVEKQIPYDAPVTIVRGGTGSGKTTRYPLMLSLFSPSQSIPIKILVAQPRRLACQTAARRVAFEQGYDVGTRGCPIGYAIRFEAFPAQTGNRTVDFQTPGVLLRQAMNDPLLRDVTHLCIDEVHERNADMDLLLALAKEAQQRREHHESLPPLRLILMSATLDCSQWKSYFSGGQEKSHVKVVDVPDIRRFPIDTVHLGEKGFPKIRGIRKLEKGRHQASDDLDSMICEATAELAAKLFRSGNLGGGSILCFLPGIEEIRRCSQRIRNLSKGKKPTICFLHSSLTSQEQAQVFLPGRKIILSTNLAETSVTIPDVKVVIDSGRERQFSLLDSSSEASATTVVGSQLVTVDISQASAKQRAGRAGRVSAGECYRLYSRNDLQKFLSFTVPEMQRMGLSQLALHSISMYNPSSFGSPLSLLMGAPDPPSKLRLRQTLHGLAQQGLVDIEANDVDLNKVSVSLTSLGQAVSVLPATPRIGRMIMLGLTLRAIDPALTIAALLSAPKVFSGNESRSPDKSEHCSDVIVQLEEYTEFLGLSEFTKERHPRRAVFEQVSRVRKQLERAIRSHVRPSRASWDMWNANSHRVAAQAGLICGATPHVAHLVHNKFGLATRDVPGKAKIHPNSVNFGNDRRAHWYVYHELRKTKVPYVHVTTAASPLELALFVDANRTLDDDFDSDHEDDTATRLDAAMNACLESDNFLFVTDQWVPVEASMSSQRETIRQLRQVLMYDFLQEVASDPSAFVKNDLYERLVLFVLAAIDYQRLPK